MNFLTKIFGSNERVVEKLQPLVDAVNGFESSVHALNDEQLRAKTGEFRERLKKGETLEGLLPEAFAVVREGAKRSIGQRHFDVQIMGGIVLHEGKIAEMKTGEGKTLTSTLPIYLNALKGSGVHVVTVNDYLSRRDANWMGQIFHFLGLSTSCINQQTISYRFEPNVADDENDTTSGDLTSDGQMKNLRLITRQEAYQTDITYGTNNEFGFDYLRDNMVSSLEEMVQPVRNASQSDVGGKNLSFAIVDEVDSILIDEARTPLIISAPDAESTKLYERFAKITPKLKAGEHYEVDEKMKTVTLTDAGINRVEELLGAGNIYADGNIEFVHHLEQSLRAEVIMKNDRDYVVRDGQVVIVDDFTGRMMPGRRYSDGLHQAIEAKEGVAVQRESRTLATITFQNYFRLYEKLAGMTGTATTSAEEFAKVYKLDVVEIPTHRDMVREDLGDIVYKTEEMKFAKIVERIKEANTIGQPVLVGTIAIEKSEYLAALLEREGVPHRVLNAKQHEKEANIIVSAGMKGSVTIATNMAGRGTDIKLGEGVKELGGLFIIGTERHEARRIDNQLRGRAGRQGDPGKSQFYLSLEDELMRRFGGEKLKGMMTTLNIPEDEPIQNAIITRVIESAQTKIEGFNFDIRKHVLDYDDVMNKQREVVYRRRRAVLETKDMRTETMNLLDEEFEKMIGFHTAMEEAEWNLHEIVVEMKNLFPAVSENMIMKTLEDIRDDRSKDELEKRTMIREKLTEEAKKYFFERETAFGVEMWSQVQKALLMRSTDTLWMNHLDEIDYLRQGIGLRGYGQRDPLVEYKREAFDLFMGLLDAMRKNYLMTVFKVAPTATVTEHVRQNIQLHGATEDVEQFGAAKQVDAGHNPSDGAIEPQAQIVSRNEVGRNDPCPCGAVNPVTGEVYKYKKCGMIHASHHIQ